MIAGTVLFGIVTYGLMLAAYFLAARRSVHIPLMVTVMLCDIAMPFYLYLNKDWYRRLIEEGELTSYLLWTHIVLLITLYTLYALQIQAGRRLVAGAETVRAEHRAQGKAILLVRAFVIATGALLVEVNPPA
jgi:hypothetical protein